MMLNWSSKFDVTTLRIVGLTPDQRTADRRDPLAATITARALLDAINSVGFTLRPARDREAAPLYLWATPHRSEVVYIGKAANETRLNNEIRLSDRLDPHGDRISVGFVHLIRRNRAIHKRLTIEPRNGRIDGFDPTPALATLNDWPESAAATALRERIDAGEWSTTDIETILIRTTVRFGVPVGNSACASQWESWLNDPRDTLAVMAADRVRACEQPPD